MPKSQRSNSVVRTISIPIPELLKNLLFGRRQRSQEGEDRLDMARLLLSILHVHMLVRSP